MEVPMTKHLFVAVTCLCAILLTGGWQGKTQTTNSGKAVLEAYVSAWNRHDFAALDKLLTPDAVHEDIAWPSRDEGPAQIKEFMRQIENGRIKRFSDYYDFASFFHRAPAAATKSHK